jgi:23S rRNA pseudouridine955/2504/2580 synthase
MSALSPQSNKVQFIEISTHHAGQRIDNFLLSLEKGVPKSRIYRALRKGEVRVNKGRIKQTYKLQLGDVVRVPPLRLAEPAETPQVSDSLRALIETHIVFEDEAMLVLNKPAGLAVHAGSQIQMGVIEALRQIRAELPFLELVHRLDRDTSGCLLLAKSRESLLNLQQQMLSDGIDKRYLTLLKGHITQDERLVEKPLEKNTMSSGERMVQVSEHGKYAKTLFIQRDDYSTAQLVEVKLFTGRTHQIRVHAASTGHPVAGDDKYGDKAFNKVIKTHGLKRMFLHAWRLTITHPISQTGLELEAPLPDELSNVLTQLKAS